MPAESSSNTVEDRPTRRRVRTGCQRCRIRRRKCDERRPVCSNCADRNFECQYGLQLRFPAGNARTAPRVETAPPTQYTQIRFADDPEDDKNGLQRKGNNDTIRRDSNASHTEANTRPSERRIHFAAGSEIPESSEDATDESTRAIPQSAQSASPVHADTYQFRHFAQPRQHEYASARHLEADSAEHGAIQSLVSLATSVEQPFLFEDDALSHNQLVVASEDGNSQNDSGPRAPTLESSSVVTTTTLGQNPKSPSDSVSEERDVELLRYYRYNVAPWLDMLDLNHNLGIHLPTIGAESPSITYALHALSARHRELASGIPEIAQFESDRYYNMSKWGIGTIRSVEIPDTLEARIIRLIVDLISAPLSHWTRQLETSRTVITSLYSYALKPGLPASLFWCLFRFDLAAALLNETFMTMDLDFALPQGSLSDGLISVLDNPVPKDNLSPNWVDRYALRALCLCGTAVSIRQDHRRREAGDEHPERTRPQNYMIRWQNTWTELSSWYTGRHKFVKPLLELSLSAGEVTGSSAFPTIVFTTAAATLANLAYHTAAMILLDCKPKTLKVSGHVASLHWHAQRTCAIAVSNTRFQGWDPCMITCVLRAARKMTHRDQQVAVLETLRRGREETGWKIDEDLQRLQEFWRLAEHS